MPVISALIPFVELIALRDDEGSFFYRVVSLPLDLSRRVSMAKRSHGQTAGPPISMRNIARGLSSAMCHWQQSSNQSGHGVRANSWRPDRKSNSGHHYLFSPVVVVMWRSDVVVFGIVCDFWSNAFKKNSSSGHLRRQSLCLYTVGVKVVLHGMYTETSH